MTLGDRRPAHCEEPVAERHRCGLLTARACAAELRHDVEAAARLHEQAARAWEAYGHPYEAAQARLALGRLREILGDRSGAAEATARGLEGCAALGVLGSGGAPARRRAGA